MARKLNLALYRLIWNKKIAKKILKTFTEMPAMARTRIKQTGLVLAF